VVSVGADQVVILEQRGGWKDQRRGTRAVGGQASTTQTKSRERSARSTVPDSGSIATGFPAVIQMARIGGSLAAITSGPKSGSSTVRGAAGTPLMKV